MGLFAHPKSKASQPLKRNVGGCVEVSPNAQEKQEMLLISGEVSIQVSKIRDRVLQEFPASAGNSDPVFYRGQAKSRSN